MATAAQITANHANAKLSTGPRTPEGKSRCAHNAVRHGLTAKHLIVRPDEQEEFSEFHRSLLHELAPEGALEAITFQELLHAAWNLRRFRRIEAESYAGDVDPLTDPDCAALLDRLSRYQARAQRAYYRALQELRVLQTDRAIRAEELDPEAAAALPPLAVIHESAKQSQSDVQAQAVKLAMSVVDYEADLHLAAARARRAEAEGRGSV